jgi:hypothetical protein
MENAEAAPGILESAIRRVHVIEPQDQSEMNRKTHTWWAI